MSAPNEQAPAPVPTQEPSQEATDPRVTQFRRYNTMWAEATLAGDDERAQQFLELAEPLGNELAYRASHNVGKVAIHAA